MEEGRERRDETNHVRGHVVPSGARPPSRWTIAQRGPVPPAYLVPTYVFLPGGFSGAIPDGRGQYGRGETHPYFEGMTRVRAEGFDHLSFGWGVRLAGD